MAETTAISWADATWNPWQGCSEVSPGCDHCYARTLLERWGKPWEVQRSAATTFAAPLGWKEPRFIFTCSMSDFFHRAASLWWQDAWDIMARTPRHTYLVLTKRPGLMAHWAKTKGWLPNVWAGASVESAKYLPRLDVLARVPAPVRFLSAEPLLGPLDLRPWLGHPLSWVIVGAESGPHHRPMDLEWARDIQRQCQEARVPFWFKQSSALRPGQGVEALGRLYQERPRLEGVLL